MESLQGPLNSCFFGESHLELNYLEQQGLVLDSESALRLEEEEEQVLMISSLEDNMPFLQMLQSVEYSPNYSSQQQCFFPFKDPTNFQTLLRLQHLKNHNNNNNNNNNNVQELDQKSCVTHDVMVEMQQQQQQQSHSPVKSESYELHQQHHQTSASASCCVENNNNKTTPTKAITAATEKCGGRGNSNTQEVCQKSQQVGSVATTTTRERKKRKRTRPAKNKEDVENQRMTHIAVERNRRRQMNDHLSVLRSLMPPSYIQRGDQASIIGGAIDFVKELEQLLQSLEAQKRMRRKNNNNSSNKNEDAIGFGSSSNSSSTTNGGYDGIMRSSTTSLSLLSTEEGNFGGGGGGNGDELKAENKSESAEIEVTLIQTHVNLKIQCKRRHGQLVKAIVALEDLRLSILHLNITSSSDDSVLYSLNLKIEEGCRLRSANEIAEAVHHIFNFING
ncbi:transcription factor bHLH57-like isoform X1 [Arachis stenosperma]|uniref:transcription factor bHLH57-like isoform X1 n=2 Tax=Arachis stenosperma TaxID=217475 RepID=UPI0025AD396D|nr:transcription factor bHLH57-like isoform X1 [Arachis stenosperma]